MPTVFDFEAVAIDGAKRPLRAYEGSVLLIVNVASKCGLTPQYAALEKLHEAYASRGLRVLGFPANEFGAQEPGTDDEIKAFCETTYGVTFDMFSKVKVKGDGIHPLFEHLTSDPQHGGKIKWNFNKFLIAKDGTIAARFEPPVDPLAPEVTQAIEKLL